MVSNSSGEKSGFDTSTFYIKNSTTFSTSTFWTKNSTSTFHTSTFWIKNSATLIPVPFGSKMKKCWYQSSALHYILHSLCQSLGHESVRSNISICVQRCRDYISTLVNQSMLRISCRVKLQDGVMWQLGLRDHCIVYQASLVRLNRWL